MGKKKQPHYRIVAADSRRARDGRFLEIVGTYDPITKPAKIKLMEDKLTKWFDDGAVPTDTVKAILTQTGFTEKYTKAKKGGDVSDIATKTELIERKKKTRKVKKAAIKAAEEAESAKAEKAKVVEEAPAEEAPATEEAPAKEEAPATEEATAKEEAPVEEAKAEETPAEETKVEETSEEKPADEEK
jgi:small subunit ribosomal protein S16